MKKITLLLTITLLNHLGFSQSSFAWTNQDNDTIIANLAQNEYSELKFNIERQNTDTLRLGVEVIKNEIPSSWDGLVCIYGSCLGGIPEEGFSRNMSSLFGTEQAYVRLTINSFEFVGVGELRIRVYNLENPNDDDTATWLLNAGTASIEDANALSRFNVFPNPTSDIISFRPNIDINKVSLFDYMGNKVIVKNLFIARSSIFSLNISSLSEGIYFLETYDKSMLRSRNKIIIQ